jgi:uncharacterized SAM-binding protein YcdF (DUF218 family)
MADDEASGGLDAMSDARPALPSTPVPHRHRFSRNGKPKSRTRRLLLSLLAVILTLVIAWGVAGYVLLVKPSLNAPRHVDAVVVLGPPTADGRFDVGYQLVESGYASNLVVSGPTPNVPQLKQLCRDGIAKAKIICFQPDPRTTRGEAQKIKELAQRYRWKSIMVVTSTYHVSRARTIIQRCFSGTVLMEAARRGIGLAKWAYQFVYQTGGYLRVITHQSC